MGKISFFWLPWLPWAFLLFTQLLPQKIPTSSHSQPRCQTRDCREIQGFERTLLSSSLSGTGTLQPGRGGTPNNIVQLGWNHQLGNCAIYFYTGCDGYYSLWLRLVVLLMLQKSGYITPVEVGRLTHVLQGLEYIHPKRWLFGDFKNPSTVLTQMGSKVWRKMEVTSFLQKWWTFTSKTIGAILPDPVTEKFIYKLW